jgi:7-cyano-7-deazaguanine tRNA-ribosyltransferase
LSFEIIEKDLLGRIGKLRTKSGTIITPLILPVVNPSIQLIPASSLKEEFKCQAIITNAYILLKNYAQRAINKKIHRFLDFDGIIMTDSGAYQILIYNNIQATPEEIINFQEEVDSDIAVILDVPTGWNTNKKRAKWTVDETIKRAKMMFNIKKKSDILWVGPIQGGKYLDLIDHSASEMSKYPFDIYALGSPTPIMEQYLFSSLVKMILTAKNALSIDKPLHLFGAGHPIMFPFAIALGCDIFDSAAYALFARDQKYMTSWGTLKLRDIEYFPCSCNICSSITPNELREKPRAEIEALLARHNLNICFTEINTIKQAIHEGRLWEMLQMRSRSHPSLKNAFNEMKRATKMMVAHTPVSKRKGLFYYESFDLNRPEIVRFQSRVENINTNMNRENVLLLLPFHGKPMHVLPKLMDFLNELFNSIESKINIIKICFYSAPLGIVPFELDDVYPVSQMQASYIDKETEGHVLNSIDMYIRKVKHNHIILYMDEKNEISQLLNIKLSRMSQNIGFNLQVIQPEYQVWSKESTKLLSEKITQVLELVKELK